jgi:Ca-activated chloride channel family protein
MTLTAHASNGARLVTPTGEALPLERVSITAAAEAGIARTRLHQHFTNRHAEPLELTYAFPLPVDGAVAGYEIRAGQRVIKGRVERRDDARDHFEQARLEGRTAGLVEQERPNLFTQRLGNIPAHTDVIVELTIDHPVRWISGFGWEWRFPTVVAPRYLGAKGTVTDADRVTVDVINGATSPTASIQLTIGDHLTAAPTSATHAITASGDTVTLAGEAQLDRDIAIRWIATEAMSCALHRARPLTAERAGHVAYGLVTIAAPTRPTEHFTRDLVLLLDISG